MNGELKHSPDPSQLLTFFFFFASFPDHELPLLDIHAIDTKHVLHLINMEDYTKHKVNTSMNTCENTKCGI